SNNIPFVRAIKTYLIARSETAVKGYTDPGTYDMGAAGITCSTSEMSAKGKVGMIIHLDKVPTRQKNMQPFEILLSESQERMLIVCQKNKEQLIKDIFDKWDLPCEQIGEVTDTERLEYYFHGEKVADVPAESLVLGGGAPVYEREYQKPAYMDYIEEFNPFVIETPVDLLSVAKQMAQSPNLASKKWIYEQYDSMVCTNTVTTNAPSDAAIVRIKGTQKALAVTTDCNPFYVYANAHKGAMIAVCEAARNIVCSGAEPLAITNCLNFGNPYNPEVYWQFVHAIQGMGEACQRLNTPVTGGNVSFYNQTVHKSGADPVYPTPTIGMVGLLENVDDKMTLSFKEKGDLIYVIGKFRNDIGSSEYLRVVHGIYQSNCPHFDLEEEMMIQNTAKYLIKTKCINAAHDISEGGLFFTLLECAMAGNLGFVANTNSEFRKDAYLFGESQSRVVVTVPVANENKFTDYLYKNNIPYEHIGEVYGSRINIDNEYWGKLVDWKETYDNVLSIKMES
ncbi:MAG: phosphoribosylformylglycinamidine synthase subunit PurL, partial [Saprospiraceae bacterium]|nr:phosphoribosylformylglycinamidine synthase subunit PurL [Saprospiraceae bacterium]